MSTGSSETPEIAGHQATTDGGRPFEGLRQELTEAIRGAFPHGGWGGADLSVAAENTVTRAVEQAMAGLTPELDVVNAARKLRAVYDDESTTEDGYTFALGALFSSVESWDAARGGP
jgi:hypothetical protein